PGAAPKKLISWVRPGVLLTRASLRAPVTALIALDLPEFERPTNATSGPSGRRKPLGSEALGTNFAAAMAGPRAERCSASSVQSAPHSDESISREVSESVDEMIDEPRGRRVRPSTVLAAVAVVAAAVLTGTAPAQEQGQDVIFGGSVEAGREKST